MNRIPILRPARTLTAAALLLTGLGTTAAPALAASSSGSQAVLGTTASVLSLTPGPAAALVDLQPGSTATGTGTLLVQDTLATPWTLTVSDSKNAGHPAAAQTGCASSEPALINPLGVAVAAGAGTGTLSSSPAVSLSSSAQTVATGTGSLNLSAGYTDTVGATESLVTGCAYSLTAVYTLQG